MNPFDQDKLLMSDSLQGMIPEVDDQFKNYEESIIIVGIEYLDEEFRDVIAGSIVGVAFEKETIKVDFRKNTLEAYKFLKICLENQRLSCRTFYLQIGEEEIVMSGPYKIAFPKLTDLDHKEKMCTVSLDLIRVDSEKSI